MTKKVVSFGRAVLKREFPGLFTSERAARLFDLPDGECRRTRAAGQKPGNGDEVELGQSFVGALFRLYGEFGLPARVPATYGELLGAVSYCQVLFQDNAYPRINEADDALWLEAADDTLVKYSPELLPSVRAYRAGDRAELERIGREVMTAHVLSWHYVEAYQGWAGDPYLKEHGIEKPTAPGGPRLRLV